MQENLLEADNDTLETSTRHKRRSVSNIVPATCYFLHCVFIFALFIIMSISFVTYMIDVSAMLKLVGTSIKQELCQIKYNTIHAHITTECNVPMQDECYFETGKNCNECKNGQTRYLSAKLYTPVIIANYTDSTHITIIKKEYSKSVKEYKKGEVITCYLHINTNMVNDVVVENDPYLMSIVFFSMSTLYLIAIICINVCDTKRTYGYFIECKQVCSDCGNDYITPGTVYFAFLTMYTFMVVTDIIFCEFGKNYCEQWIK